MIGLSVRPATSDDARILWAWRNDETTRRSSFQTQPIPWHEHLAWFQSRLSDPTCQILFLCKHGQPVAQVRFDFLGGQAEVHLTVDPPRRGQGFGSAALKMATSEATKRFAVQRFIAHVRPENQASRRVFEKAGFQQAGTAALHGQISVRFMLEASL